MKPLLTRLMCVVVLLWAGNVCGQSTESLPANGREFLQWLEEADEARSVADRLQKQTRALEAILKVDAGLLEATLDGWLKDGRRNPFVAMCWRQLMRKDEARALKMVEKARGLYSFDQAAAAVYGCMAHSDPDRAYEEVKRICGPKNTYHWHAFAIMEEVGAEWFRREHLGALARLKSPDLPGNEGCHV